MKQRVQEQIQAETRGLTHEEEIAYYERSVLNGPLAAWWRSLVERKAKQSARR